LRILGVAAVASHFPGFARWSHAAAHPNAAGEGPRPKDYTPVFFTAAEFAVVTKLTELIIPSDETPGAREAGVNEFVDFMAAHDVEAQPHLRAGLAWLDERSRRDHQRQFIELQDGRQNAILETVAYKAKHRAGEEVGQEFFRRMRDLTAMGFYSSEIGYHELDNPALHPWGASPACPHVDDRAHAHLPPPKWAP
jgi:hypothetical protein